jgi:hypothetical protein
MSGQSRKLRELLERISADDRPRIPDFDELLEALRREHGEPRADLPIPHTATPKVMRDGRVDPGGATVDPASTQ